MKPPTLFSTAEAAEEAFYDAMRRGDLAAMMALWADDEDVVCIHPGGGRLVGLQAIRAGFESIFATGGIDIRPTRARVHSGASMEIRTLVEQILVPERSATRIIEVASTNVYVKVSRGWRIVLHHAGPGIEASGSEPRAPSAVLH
ncbi:MAG: hypothetical protein RIS35_2157 [Pseudomonadota bacterium]|jgi:uncharacterized protein (TIGR02246 family)